MLTPKEKLFNELEEIYQSLLDLSSEALLMNLIDVEIDIVNASDSVMWAMEKIDHNEI